MITDSTRGLVTALALSLAACGGAPPPAEEPVTQAASMPGPDQARLLLTRLQAANDAPDDSRPALLAEIEALPLDAPDVLEASRICVRMHRDTLELSSHHQAFQARAEGIEQLPPEQQEAVRAEARALQNEASTVEAIMERCVQSLTQVIVAYGLEAEFADDSEAEPVAAQVDGVLSDDDPRVEQDDSPYDDYPVDLVAGWQLEVDMRSTDFDSYLWLIGPDGISLVQDDDGGEGTDAHISHSVGVSGRYVIRANSYDGAGRGAYQLQVRAGAPGT